MGILQPYCDDLLSDEATDADVEAARRIAGDRLDDAGVPFARLLASRDRAAVAFRGVIGVEWTRHDINCAAVCGKFIACHFLSDADDKSHLNNVYLHSAFGAKKRTLNKHGMPVADVEFSHDGMFVLVSSRATKRGVVYDTADGRIVYRGNQHDKAASTLDRMYLPPCDNWVLEYHVTGFRVIDLPSGEQVARVDIDNLEYVFPGRDGRKILAIDGVDVATMYDVDGNELTRLEQVVAPIRSVDFSRDGRFVCIVGQENVGVWDAATGELLGSPEPPNSGRRPSRFHTAYGVVFSRSDNRFALVNVGKTVCVFDVDAGPDTAICELTGHTGQVSSVTWLPDGRLVTSSCTDRTLRVWDTRTGGQLACCSIGPWHQPSLCLLVPATTAPYVVMTGGSGIAAWFIDD